MSEHYVQRITAAPSKRARIARIVGTALEFLSVPFILLAAFLNVYMLIGLFLTFGAGVAVLQIYNNEPRSFEYDFNKTRLVVSSETTIRRRRILAEISFENASSFGELSADINPSDIFACEKPNTQGAYFLEYKLSDTDKRLIFQPDDYLKALIIGVLEDKTKRAETEEKA